MGGSSRNPSTRHRDTNPDTLNPTPPGKTPRALSENRVVLPEEPGSPGLRSDRFFPGNSLRFGEFCRCKGKIPFLPSG